MKLTIHKTEKNLIRFKDLQPGDWFVENVEDLENGNIYMAVEQHDGSIEGVVIQADPSDIGKIQTGFMTAYQNGAINEYVLPVTVSEIVCHVECP